MYGKDGGGYLIAPELGLVRTETGRNEATRRSLPPLHLSIPKTLHFMIVHHAGGLQIGIENRRPHELEPPGLEVSAHRI